MTGQISNINLEWGSTVNVGRMGRRFQKLSGFYGWIISGLLLAGGVGSLIWHYTRPVLTIQLVNVITENAIDLKEIKPEKLKIDDKSPKIIQKNGNIYLEYSRVSIGIPIRLEFDNFDKWEAGEEVTKKGRNKKTAKLYPKPEDLTITNLTQTKIKVKEILHEGRAPRMQPGTFVEPGQSIKLTNALRFGVNTVILGQAGFKPVHVPHEDRSPEWAANATVEVTDADFAGQEDEASLSLIFRDISFDSIYLNLDAFLNSKITKEFTLFHHGGTNQVGATNWSTLTNPIQYTINPAVTNEIKFTKVHIGSKGFVRVTINYPNFSPINIDYEGLKDGDNVTKLISGNSDPALSAPPSISFIPKKATLTIKPDFNWTTNDYTGLKVTPLPGVTNKPTSFVYELTPFKEHTFEFTGAGLKIKPFTAGPYKPQKIYTTNIVVELEDELAEEWTRHKGQIEKTKGLMAPGIIAKYKKILEDAKSDIVKANGKLSELYKENEITIAGNNLKNEKEKIQ